MSQLPLFGESIPRKLSGKRLVAALVEIAKANGGFVRSAEARAQLVDEGVLRGGDAGIRLLYQALSKSNLFLRVRHGVYRLNLAYEPTPRELPDLELREELAALLEELRAYDSKVLH